MALRTDLAVKWDGRVVPQKQDQLLLVLGHLRVGLDLKNGVDEDPRPRPLHQRLVHPDHLQKSWNQSRAGIEFDVRGKDEVRVGLLARDVPANVDRVINPSEKR